MDLGRSQSTISTWASREREIADTVLTLPMRPGAIAGITSADEFVSVAVAAQILDVDKHTIRNWIEAGRLAGHRPNRHGAAWRIPRRDVEALEQTSAGHSVQELADWYCVADATVRRWIRTGQFRSERENHRGIFQEGAAFAEPLHT